MHVEPPEQLESHGQQGPPGCAHVQTPVKHQRPELQPPASQQRWSAPPHATQLLPSHVEPGPHPPPVEHPPLPSHELDMHGGGEHEYSVPPQPPPEQ
jgi:hypothetical protein